ncbi:MAG: GxxExxY protein [Xanthomonadales bacterium]|nr:GxxExxY protein [Xanthomonadales bacterium]
MSHRAIGCALEVHRTLGCGFLESVYAEALAQQLAEHGICFQRERACPVWFKGHLIGRFIADFVVEHSLVLELKAVERLLPIHQAQLINYLKATRLPTGLLLNFGTRSLQIKRAVNRLNQIHSDPFV